MGSEMCIRDRYNQNYNVANEQGGSIEKDSSHSDCNEERSSDGPLRKRKETMSTSRHLTGLRRFAKAAVAVCASLGLVLAAGGCGASSGESKTIYFWNNLVGDDGPAMQRIVKEYNAQSDYKVVFQPMNGGDLTTKIYSVMQTGKNIPDIILSLIHI